MSLRTRLDCHDSLHEENQRDNLEAPKRKNFFVAWSASASSSSSPPAPSLLHETTSKCISTNLRSQTFQTMSFGKVWPAHHQSCKSFKTNMLLCAKKSEAGFLDAFLERSGKQLLRNQKTNTGQFLIILSQLCHPDKPENEAQPRLSVAFRRKIYSKCTTGIVS